jgi:hypothetical protein
MIMTPRKSDRSKPPVVSSENLSPIELSRFLRSLAALYRDVTWGNPALSQALSDLARDLARESQSSRNTLKADRNKQSHNTGDPLRFASFNADEIRRFLDDNNNSKFELIDLASARFSIPRSRLMRLRTEEVRERIRAALLNEDSLHIISQEAQRGGAKRSS